MQKVMKAPGRPAIPAEIVRAVLTESGHRCAVCGEGYPLDKAHIIPWRKSKSHKAPDLICLCPNCHRRADGENWGEKALREYKTRPWVQRRYEDREERLPPARIEIRIDLTLEQFNNYRKRMLTHALAGFLEIDPDSVKIMSVKEGSVRVILEMPGDAAIELLRAYRSGDVSLAAGLEELPIVKIKREKGSMPISNRQRRFAMKAVPKSPQIVNRRQEERDSKEASEVSKKAVYERTHRYETPQRHARPRRRVHTDQLPELTGEERTIAVAKLLRDEYGIRINVEDLQGERLSTLIVGVVKDEERARRVLEEVDERLLDNARK